MYGRENKSVSYFCCCETITSIRMPTKDKAAKMSKTATGNGDSADKT